MRGHASTRGEDSGCGAHALNVLRRGLLTDEDCLQAFVVGFHGRLRSEHDLTYGSSRGSRETDRKDFGLLLGRRVEDRVENLVKLGRRNPHHGCLLIDHLLVNHVHRHPQGGQTGSLSDPALEHPEMTLLDGELDVLHVMEVLLESQADVIKFLVNLRHGGLQRLEILVLLCLGGLVERIRGTDSGDDILALRIDQPFTVEFVVSGGRIA